MRMPSITPSIYRSSANQPRCPARSRASMNTPIRRPRLFPIGISPVRGVFSELLPRFRYPWASSLAPFLSVSWRISEFIKEKLREGLCYRFHSPLQIWSQNFLYSGCSFLRCRQFLLHFLALVQSFPGRPIRLGSSLFWSFLSCIYNE